MGGEYPRQRFNVSRLVAGRSKEITPDLPSGNRVSIHVQIKMM